MKSNARPEEALSGLPNFELAELRDFDLATFQKTQNQDLAKLMLAFSLVYNDFKDYNWMQYLFIDALTRIDKNTISNTRGQLYGMIEHCTRMVIANLLELLEAIREHEKLFDTREFKRILYYLGKKHRDLPKDWWELVGLAKCARPSKPHTPTGKFRKTLIKIRNNGTYHYYQIDSLYQGLEYYIVKKGNKGYVSMGNNLEKTRFYFADAAIQFLHRKTIDEFGPQFKVVFKDYIEKVNRLLRFIIEIYLVQILNVSI